MDSETRLTLLMKLGEGRMLSIARLTAGSTPTRQAVTKHLRILENAGFVRGIHRGRESLFELERDSLPKAQDAFERVSRQWYQALDRLKSFVEE